MGVCGASDGVFLGGFWLETEKGLWEGFWSEIPNGPLAFNGGGARDGKTWWRNQEVFAISVTTPFVNVAT